MQEWELGRSGNLRRHLPGARPPALSLAAAHAKARLPRLAGFTRAQRQETLGPSGLLFTRMPLAQQQQFIALALESQSHQPLHSLEELDGATLRVEHTQPGAFQWGASSHPGHGYASRWVVPLELGTRGRRVFRPMVVGHTPAEVLKAVRRLDPRLREALLQARRQEDPRLDAASHVIEEDQIAPTRLELALVYVPCASNARQIHLQTSYADYNLGWPQTEVCP